MDLHGLELGVSKDTLSLESWDDNRQAALALARQARRTLQIFSRDLEPAIYEQPDFIAAVTQLATHSRSARIAILLQDPTRAVKEGHRLVELARRLSSYIEIRRPAQQHAERTEAFLIADEAGVLRRPLADRYEGMLSFHAPLEARRLVTLFAEMWEKSESDPELRRLHL
jgi:hypothetical protein